MILNAKNNQFVFYFGPNFWCEKVKKIYNDFYKSLLLPYDNIDDFMMSNLQTMKFPGLSYEPVKQTGVRGAERIYKNSEPIKDMQNKKFSITFKASEAYMNWIIMYHNFIEFLDFNNKSQNHEMMTLGILNNEGFLMTTIKFHYPIMTGISDVELNYTEADNSFNKFTCDFEYNDWDIAVNYNEMINLYGV